MALPIKMYQQLQGNYQDGLSKFTTNEAYIT